MKIQDAYRNLDMKQDLQPRAEDPALTVTIRLPKWAKPGQVTLILLRKKRKQGSKCTGGDGHFNSLSTISLRLTLESVEISNTGTGRASSGGGSALIRPSHRACFRCHVLACCCQSSNFSVPHQAHLMFAATIHAGQVYSVVKKGSKGWILILRPDGKSTWYSMRASVRCVCANASTSLALPFCVCRFV